MPPSLLAKSAQGATFLILLQVSSRALTFLVNQILLRYLSPQTLGVATQLELFSISTLYFSRESIRVTLQRRPSSSPSSPTTKSNNAKAAHADDAQTSSESEGVREAANLSYLSIFLGIPLVFIFQYLYKRSASPDLLSTPNFLLSLHIYVLATIVELCHEPLFAIMQQNLSYSIRTASEMQATLARCLVTCGSAIYLHSAGVLPFALGQLVYAILLLLGYFIRLYPLSLRLNPFKEGALHLPPALLRLAGTLYAQSLFKQLLTSGDSYLISVLTSLSSQGAYALASNYGGLLARVLFQPIEEASRTLFARLLPPLPAKTEEKTLKQAVRYLTTVLRLYSLLALVLVTLAPPLTGPLLGIVAGKRWTDTEAPDVLGAYCYYIPLLAANGVLEAYVNAVATPKQLRTQSVWMVGWSALFAVTGTIVLRIYQKGAQGLVVVNAVVMLGRIVWSWVFVSEDLKKRGEELEIGKCMANFGSLAVGVAGRGILNQLLKDRIASLRDWVWIGGTVGVSGLGILACERLFLVRCWRMMRPDSVESRKHEAINKSE